MTAPTKQRSLQQIGEALRNPSSQEEIDAVAEELLNYSPSSPRQEKTQTRLFEKATTIQYVAPVEDPGFIDLEENLAVRHATPRDVQRIWTLHNLLNSALETPRLRNNQIISDHIDLGLVGTYDQRTIATLMYNQNYAYGGIGIKVALFGLIKPNPELGRVFMDKIIEESDFESILYTRDLSSPKATKFADEMGFVPDPTDYDPNQYIYTP